MLQHTKRQVKLLGMICSAMFITALCVISLMKLRRPKSKSLYVECIYRVCFVFRGNHVTGKHENGKIAENSFKSWGDSKIGCQLSIAGLRLLPPSLSAAARDPRDRRDLKKEGRLFSSSPLPSFLCAPAHSIIPPPIGWICCSCHYAPAHCPTPLPIDSIVALPNPSCKQRWRKPRFVSKDSGKVS